MLKGHEKGFMEFYGLRQCIFCVCSCPLTCGLTLCDGAVCQKRY